MAGPTGLDYTALQATMRMMAVPELDWPLIFEAIRTLEAEALSVMNEKD